ncbi:diguanylate cyclase [Planctomicrobium sp. SH664]|uniref:diguanylate cyclase n=1 Tax=Planctomicrobium sp. SH664 TaxID=3448125 RepID=UPI003F5CBC9F
MDSQLQKISHLPSLPMVAVRLLKIFSDPEVGISEVVQLLQMDPALSGKILKAANTSQFGLKKPVSDLQRAVVLLGKKSVMALALGFSLAEASMNTGPYADLYSDFWFQSLVRGCAASLLAEKYTRVEQGEAFTIALLARIGRLAMINHDPERMSALIRKSEQSGMPLDLLEREAGGITSTDVTRSMLREWKLPAHCLLAADAIEDTVEQACQNRTGSVSLSDLLRLSTHFSEFFSGENRGIAIAKVYELSHSILNESPESANELIEQIRCELDNHSHLFSLDMTKVGSPVELLSQAMNHLSLLAMNAVLTREADSAPASEIMEENGRLRRRVLELTQSTMTDPLTSLYNRNYLLQQLQERANQARVTQSSVAVLFVDVDHFKRVNDSYGHLVGDEVLKSVALALRSDVRESDIVTRYGGEEFVILTTASDRLSLRRQAERVRRSIESQVIVRRNLKIHVTVSVGGAMAIPDPLEASFVRQLLESADTALYLSKRGGRNCVTIMGEEAEPLHPQPVLATATS